MDCVICGKDSGKGKCCSSTCRSKLSRLKDKQSVANATVPKCCIEGVASLDGPSVTGSMDVVTLAMVDAACGDKLTHGLPDNYGQEDCQCQHCNTNRINGNRHVINHGFQSTTHRRCNELNRVTLPGDVDYNGVASTLTA